MRACTTNPLGMRTLTRRFRATLSRRLPEGVGLVREMGFHFSELAGTRMGTAFFPSSGPEAYTEIQSNFTVAGTIAPAFTSTIVSPDLSRFPIFPVTVTLCLP